MQPCPKKPLWPVWIIPNAAARIAEVFNQPKPQPPYRRKSDKEGK